MRRSLLLASAVFVGGIVAGALVFDAATSEDGVAGLPSIVVDEAPTVVGDPLPAGAAELLAVEDLAVPSPGAGVVPISGDSDGGSGSEPDEVEDSPPYPWLIEPRELAPPAPGVPFYGVVESTRFIDFCADAPSLGFCPDGVGATILALGDDLPVGDFDLFVLSESPTEWWQCFPDSLGDGDMPMLLAATHPARMDITYYPVGEPGEARSVTIDLTDPADPAMLDFVASVNASGGPPFDGVHHCFGLQPARGGVVVGDALPAVNRFRYRVEVTATSFTGETDTLSEIIEYPLTRPPVSIDAMTPYELSIGVPTQSSLPTRSVVRLNYLDDGIQCADQEEALLAGELGDTVEGPGFGYFDRGVTRTVVGPFDPTYDRYDMWTVSLEEATAYQVCIWWVRSPGASFDPAHLGIVDRETRVVESPDMLRTIITADLLTAADEGPAIEAGSYQILPRACGVESIGLPFDFTEPGTGWVIDEPVVLCEYSGLAQPDHTPLQVILPNGALRTFLIPTRATRLPVNQRLELNLSTTARLCGTFLDSSCPSPFGPKLFIEVSQVPGRTNGLADWTIGSGAEFASPERPPDELAEDIQIDHFTSGVTTLSRDALLVNALFDRPVTLVASVEGEACLGTGDGTSSESALSTEHHVTLDGLCTLSEYDIRLLATDSTGRSRVFSTVDRDWRGHGATDGHHVTFRLAIESTGGFPTEWGWTMVARWYPEVDGVAVPLGDPSRCFGYTISDAQSAVWGDEIELDIYVRIWSSELLDALGNCSTEDLDSVRFEEAEGWANATFTIDDFRSGAVQVPFSTFRQVHPVVREYFRYQIAAVITGTVEE